MGFLHRLYSFDDNIDFKRGWRIARVVSVILCLISIGFLSVKGLNLGIDFRGGISWQFPANGTSLSKVTDAITGAGGHDPQVQRVGTGDIRVEVPPASSDSAKPAYEGKISSAIADVTHQSANVINENLNEVGPTWGRDVSVKAIKALIYFLIAIFLYVWLRLEWKFAVGAIIAVIHDVILSVGAYAIFRFEVTPGTVIAFLTILGYSLYDTIVVYDKIKENQGRVTPNGRMTYTDMANLSVNQTFMRSINTTLSAVIPVMSILVIGAWIMGAVTLEEFGLALLVGLISGAYSSIFVAVPLTAWIKEREPAYAAIRARMERLSPEERAALSGREQIAEAELVGTDDGEGTSAAGSRRAGRERVGVGAALANDNLADAGDVDDTGAGVRPAPANRKTGAGGPSSRPRGSVPPRPGAITPRPRKQTARRRKKK